MNRETNNIIDLIFKLRNSNNDKKFKYIQKNPSIKGLLDFSYAYKNKDEYVVTLVWNVTRYIDKTPFEEIRNKIKDDRIAYEFDEFKIVESFSEDNKRKYKLMNLIIKERSFNVMLYILNEFLDINNRNDLYNLYSYKGGTFIKRWLKYLRNNEDTELIPNVIAGLNLLKVLYSKDKSTRLFIIDKDMRIEQKGEVLSGFYTLGRTEFRIRLDYSTDLYSKLELDSKGKSINNLMNELSSVLDKKYYKELSEKIDKLFGSKEINPLDRNIPYKITLKEINNIK